MLDFPNCGICSFESQNKFNIDFIFRAPQMFSNYGSGGIGNVNFYGNEKAKVPTMSFPRPHPTNQFQGFYTGFPFMTVQMPMYPGAPNLNQPAQAQPTLAQPAQIQHNLAQHAHPQPAQIQPTHPQPANPQPAHTQSVHPQPAHPQPSYPQQPVYPKPVHSQPVYPQSITSNQRQKYGYQQFYNPYGYSFNGGK